MNKEILFELNRMKSLMNLINEQGSADINIDRLNQQQLGPKTQVGIFDEYRKMDIGPESNKNYPTIMTTKIPIIYDPIKGPQLKVFEPGTTAKNFIPNVKVFNSGEKLSNNSDAPVGNEYIEKGGKKFCLPVKAFWDEIHNKHRYIYQFTNPKTGSVFHMKLVQQKKTVVKGKETTGYNASINCLGGNNGWEFLLTPETKMTFFKRGTNEPYGNDGNELSVKSEFDTWWDSGWGTAIEIGVGVLASVVTGGIATFLVTAAKAGRLWGALNSAVLFLDKINYLGGSATLLKILTESLVEAGLMTPIAIYQFSKGNDSDGVLSLTLSFLPFLTNIPKVSKFIKTGKVFRSSDSEIIIKKIKDVGGYDVLNSNKEKTIEFLKTLTIDQQAMYQAAVSLLKESPEVVEKGIIEVLNKNGDEILDKIIKNKNIDRSTRQKLIYHVKENVNVFTGGGILPQFVRTAIPVVGISIPVVLYFNYLKEKGLSDKLAGELTNQFNDTVVNSEYLKKLIELNKKLGLGVPLTDKILFETLKNQVESNPEKIEEFIKNDKVQEMFFTTEKIEQTVKETVLPKMNEEYMQLGSKNLLDAEMIKLFNEFNIANEIELINNNILSKTKHRIEKIVDDSNPKSWKFITTTQENGILNFLDNGTREVYINNVKII